MQKNNVNDDALMAGYFGNIIAKAKEWLIRYLPSEIIGTVTALIAASRFITLQSH